MFHRNRMTDDTVLGITAVSVVVAVAAFYYFGFYPTPSYRTWELEKRVKVLEDGRQYGGSADSRR